MNYADMILHHALLQPERPAIILPDRVVTYRMMAQGILSVEERLRALNLPPNGLAAIALASPIRHLIAAAALYRGGHPTMSVRLTRDIPALGVPIAVILEGDRAMLVPGSKQVLVEDDWFAGATPDFGAAAARGFAGGDSVCRVELSSGTTGRPKAFSLSVEALGRWIRNYGLSIGRGEWSRILSLPGLASSWGFSVAAHTLFAGKTLVFAGDARGTLDMIALHRVDCLAGSTQHLRELAAAQRQAPVPCPSLACVFTGGSLPSSALLNEARAALCPNIVVQYGSTEAGATAFGPSDRLIEADGAVGYVAPWAEVEAVDDAGRVLPRGGDGMLRIRADCLARPYPEDRTDDDSFRDGWFYPRDLGRVMPDGMLIVSGRASEIIEAGGVKRAPETIEDVARRHPAVADVAAVGAAGAHGVEEVWLAIVPRAPVDAAALIAFCAQADCPVDRVVTVAAIPRNALGKVERDRLRRELQPGGGS